MVNAYAFFLLLNTGWQTVFGVISLGEGATAFVIYLLPIVFYFYFRKTALEQEVRSVFLAIVVAGLIVGIYFAYDSYVKLALGEVSDYAKEAFEYSLGRGNISAEDANDARARSGFRSFGLLESHSVSGGYVALAAFAALALMPMNRQSCRWVVVLVFGVTLLLALNFTSIIAFIAIIFLFEFNGQKILRGRLSSKVLIDLLFFAFTVTSVSMIAFSMVDDAMGEFISTNLLSQMELLLRTGDSNLSMAGLLVNSVEKYFQHIFNFPHSLLLGDGFSNFGLIKGGDIGLIESLARFGLPLFLLIIFGYFRLINAGFRAINTNTAQVNKGQGLVGLSHQSMIKFSICLTLLVFITEGHYTIWISKAILPIIFFTLALFERYLPSSTLVTNSVPQSVALTQK